MTLPLASPFTSGTKLTKLQLDQLVTAINTLNAAMPPNPLPRHYVTNTAGTSIPNSADTIVTGWTVADSANVGAFSAGSRTISVAGIYAINATITFPSSVTGYIRAQILVNGVQADINGASSISGRNTPTEVDTMMPLNVGDTVAVTAFQSSGSAQALATGPGTNHWSIAWLGNI